MGGVLKGAGGGEAGGGQESGEGFGGEFVAVFGVDGFALSEVDAGGVRGGGDCNGLVGQAFEVHFYAAGGGVPAGAVSEVVWVEVGFDVAVEAGEDVFVEGSGDACGIVIRGL